MNRCRANSRVEGAGPGVGDEVIETIKNMKGSSMLCFRVPAYVKLLYDNMSPESKKLLKEVIISVVASGKLNVHVEQRVVNVNVNVNQNVVNQRRPRDPGLLKLKLKLLEEENEELKELVERLERLAKRNGGANVEEALKRIDAALTTYRDAAYVKRDDFVKLLTGIRSLLRGEEK